MQFVSCSSQEKKIFKQSLKGEYIYRLHNEFFFTPPSPLLQTREPYPWEERDLGGWPKITKEFFRCNGNQLNSPVTVQKKEGEAMKYYDCHGKRQHGLPLREEREFIYPCLLEILNEIQKKTGHRVVITCGHRCPKHNAYSDPTSYNWNSKHQIGAEVDFYVEGMEREPLTIFSLIQSYYSERFENDSAYTTFHRYEREGINVTTPPWYNKEVFIKLYLEHEGRDRDNQHPYPYLSVQVRYDRDLDTKVMCDQKCAQNYLRH